MRAILIDMCPEITKAQSTTLHKFLNNNDSYKWDGRMGRYSNGSKVFTVTFKDGSDTELTIGVDGRLSLLTYLELNKRG